MGINFAGIELPFQPGDLLSSGMGLVGVISGFVLMALSFVIVPYVIHLVTNSMMNRPRMSGDHSEYDSAGKQVRDKYGNRIRG